MAPKTAIPSPKKTDNIQSNKENPVGKNIEE